MKCSIRGSQGTIVQKQEISILLKKLEVSFLESAWALKECRDQLVEPIWDVISNSERKAPREWKRANIVPVYEGKKTELHLKLQCYLLQCQCFTCVFVYQVIGWIFLLINVILHGTDRV